MVSEPSRRDRRPRRGWRSSSRTKRDPAGRWSRIPGSLDQAGNTLVLFPVGVLIVFGLGAVAIDSATVFLAQRRLADLSAAVANDAVSGVDIASFYGTDGTVALDGARGSVRAAQLRSGQSQDRAFDTVSCSVDAVGDRATAICTGRVRPVLASFLPGAGTRQLTATETAVGEQG